MINSMTGYGEAQGQFNSVDYAVEIKTVNNRYFKTIIRLPELTAFLEEEIEKLLRKNLSRGTVNYVLRFKDVSAGALFDIDETALQTIAEKLSRAGSSAGVNGTIDIGNLLSLPGIIRPTLPDQEVAGQIKKAILEISQEALNQLKQMRSAEGDFLEADLKNRCTAIEQDLVQIRARSEVVLQEYADKLRRRVDKLLARAELKLDEETLAREVAIFADRSDISEEIARLDSHMQQFAQCCQANDQAGRRLDFISQEMLREANTIASKASDIEITRSVVDIKCQIDRIKEQVQNIE
ncbi:MAG: YicC family protein [Planctomycetes bacterium B3_Pla]|nr:MAG: YicC family protein [Planctomycetes bacterium B3_Pla]